MSFLTRFAIRQTPAFNASRVLTIAERRSFLHTTSVRAALSESDRSKHGLLTFHCTSTVAQALKGAEVADIRRLELM